MDTKCYVVPRKVDPAQLAREVREKSPLGFVQATAILGVTNESLVRMLAEQTFRSAESGQLLARQIEIDFLLRMAGTTQIREAIDRLGAAKGRVNLLTVRADEGELKKLEKTTLKGLLRLPSKPLTLKDLQTVERAALLNALRA